MTDWSAVAEARRIDIPEDAVKNISPALTALEEAFRPLVSRLSVEIEPAIVLSESAVLGE